MRPATASEQAGRPQSQESAELHKVTLRDRLELDIAVVGEDEILWAAVGGRVLSGPWALENRSRCLMDGEGRLLDIVDRFHAGLIAPESTGHFELIGVRTLGGPGVDVVIQCNAAAQHKVPHRELGGRLVSGLRRLRIVVSDPVDGKHVREIGTEGVVYGRQARK